MAIFNNDKRTPLNNRQIKQEILILTGLTADEYKRQYDIIKNKLRNYEAITGATSPRAVNEFILSIARRQDVGAPLTAEQKAVLGFTSSNVGKYAQRVAAGNVTEQQRNYAIDSVLDTFQGFIEKTTKIPVKSDLEAFLNTPVGTRSTGRDLTGKPIIEPILRRETISPDVLRRWLATKAKELHQLQKQAADGSASFYRTNKQKVGS